MMLSLIGAIFAVVAAILWWCSAVVRLPRDVGVVTLRTSKYPVEGASVGGAVYSVGLDALGKAMSRQSKLSASAAICAGIAILCEAAPALLRFSMPL